MFIKQNLKAAHLGWNAILARIVMQSERPFYLGWIAALLHGPITAVVFDT